MITAELQPDDRFEYRCGSVVVTGTAEELLRQAERVVQRGTADEALYLLRESGALRIVSVWGPCYLRAAHDEIVWAVLGGVPVGRHLTAELRLEGGR